MVFARRRTLDSTASCTEHGHQECRHRMRPKVPVQASGVTPLIGEVVLDRAVCKNASHSAPQDERFSQLAENQVKTAFHLVREARCSSPCRLANKTGQNSCFVRQKPCSMNQPSPSPQPGFVRPSVSWLLALPRYRSPFGPRARLGPKWWREPLRSRATNAHLTLARGGATVIARKAHALSVVIDNGKRTPSF